MVQLAYTLLSAEGLLSLQMMASLERLLSEKFRKKRHSSIFRMEKFKKNTFDNSFNS